MVADVAQLTPYAGYMVYSFPVPVGKNGFIVGFT